MTLYVTWLTLRSVFAQYHWVLPSIRDQLTLLASPRVGQGDQIQ